MLRNITSIVLVSALFLSFGAASAFAQAGSDQDLGSKPLKTDFEVNSATEGKAVSGSKKNERLRADIEKLLNDARAGKVVPRERGQMKPPKSNNLSKEAKIAIGVGIAVVVIALIVKYQRDHLFDGLRLGN